ncbi:MAG: hypothetical protein JWR67_787 [Mucilaginibacter sp.]|nr:hypothetical protein [Mucilaginibacter sp.]
MKIFVASLPFNIQEANLLEAFSEFGVVNSVKIITDKTSGRSKGSGLIEMADEQRARKAIDALNGGQINGRTVVVSKAENLESNISSGRKINQTSSKRKFFGFNDIKR